MTGTHDTETLAVWWERARRDERVETLRLLFTSRTFSEHGSGDPDQPWNDGLRDGLLEFAYRTASSELFVPVQDLFGWRDRINTPATVSEDNWTWRLPWPVDRLATTPEAAERATFCRALGRAHGTRYVGRIESSNLTAPRIWNQSARLIRPDVRRLVKNEGGVP